MISSPSLLILKQICEGRHCRNTLRGHKAHEKVRLSILDIFLISAKVIISNLIYSKLEDKFIGLVESIDKFKIRLFV